MKTITEPAKTISDLCPGMSAKITIADTIIPDGEYDLGEEAIDGDGLVTSWCFPDGYVTVYFGECWLAVPVVSITHVNGHAVADRSSGAITEERDTPLQVGDSWLDSQGDVVTCRHIFDGSDLILITWGDHGAARIFWSDYEDDDWRRSDGSLIGCPA